MFAYCGNNPTKNVDSIGCLYIENHPIKTNASDPYGFSLDVSEEFLDPYVCLYYSYELISAYGRNGKFYGMDAERIALEIHAHAVLYYQGCYLSENFSDSTAISNYGDSSMPISIGSSNLEGALYDIGSYLVMHGKDIYVNNNESNGRLFAYKAIWGMNTTNIMKSLTKVKYMLTRQPKGPARQVVQ